jgi:hypothetical protein
MKNPFNSSPRLRIAAWWSRRAQVNWTVLLWAIGVPLPIVLIVGLLRGCS